MKPPLLIVNPVSGTRRDGGDVSQILAAAESILGDTVVRHTLRQGHARELAAEGVRDGYTLVIAVGGDGTFSEVVDGVLSSSMGSDDAHPSADPAVGLVDAGTGGDFCRSLGTGPGHRRCLEAIALGRERLLDVGRASFKGIDGNPVQRYFVNVLSAGVSGLAVRYAAASPSFLPGPAAYYLAALRATAVSRELPLLARITHDGETLEEIIPARLVAICNGGWFGGGMHVAPMALPDDGRLEVITATERNRARFAIQIQKVYSGDHLELPIVRHFPCDRIELRIEDETAERQFLIEADGDYLGSPPLVVEVVPGVLRVRA